MTLALTALVAAISASARDCEDTKSVTEFGRHKKYGVTPHGTTLVRVPGVGTVDAKHLRLLMKVTGSPWTLTVRDAAFRSVQVLTHCDLASGSLHWSSRVSGSVAWLDFEAPQSVTLSLPKYLVMPASAEHTFYSRQDPDPAKSRIRQLYRESVPSSGGLQEKERRRLGDAVAMLVFTWGDSSWCCSGVMVAPDLLLTNRHCGGPNEETFKKTWFWEVDIWRNMLIDLSWDGDDESREYGAAGKPIVDELNDFALIPVRPRESGNAVRVPAWSTAALGKGERVVIVHHPACAAKSITERCSVAKPTFDGWRGGADVDFTHDCDTERGSSGGPIFNARDELVGVQHLGFTYDSDCKRKDSENKAVKASSIMQSLPLDVRARLTLAAPAANPQGVQP